jgi:hypothetical protein
MKKALLLLLLAGSVVFADAQTLKETLFGGKLKNQPGSVIRKGDDLTAKIDTSHTVAPVDTAVAKAPASVTDAPASTVAVPADSAVAATIVSNEGSDNATTDTAAAEATPEPEAAAAAPKSNNALIKEYMDSVATVLKAEALTSKKVKRGSYYTLISYVIETDGQVSFGDVFLSPENSYLQQQIKDRLASETPRLAPVLNSAGVPRKVTKKYNFTLTKE